MRIPLGIDDFKELVTKRCDFVDKTLFVREILDDASNALLIARPRRFGKTLNLSMLYYFLTQENAAENRLLFKGLKIEGAQLSDGQDCMEHQGKYRVVFMTFKGIRESTFDNFCGALGILMSQIYRQHSYLATTDKLDDEEKRFFDRISTQRASLIDLKRSLYFLSEFLYKHHQQKVFLLLDEYDTPFHEAYTSRKGAYHEDVIEFMKVFFGEALKGNPYLEKGVITGILRVSLMNLFSGANSIPVHTMLTQRYATYFGFIEEEVDEYIGRYKEPIDREKIKAWYNGYEIAGITLYNPWSVLQCLSESGVLRPYWCQTGQESLLVAALREGDLTVKERIKTLLQDQAISVFVDERMIFADFRRHSEALWGLMLLSGYLKVVHQEVKGHQVLYSLKIPNLEIISVYENMLRDIYQICGREAYDALIESIAEGDIDRFATQLQIYLDESASYHDLGSKTLENIYHMLVFGILFVIRDRYFVSSNMEAGRGRPDITLVPKPDNPRRVGIIFEFKATRFLDKLEEEVTDALQQIKDGRYRAALEKHGITKALHVGLAFCGREMRMKYEKHDYAVKPTPLAAATLFQPVAVRAGKRGAEETAGESDFKTARL